MNPAPPSTTPHCNLCHMTQEEVEKASDMTIIFLGIEYALGGECAKADRKTMKMLFGDHESYSALQIRQAKIRNLSKHAVSNLRHLIKQLNDLGKKVGIVIASGWATSWTTKEVCEEFFKYQMDIAPYIIGRTPTDDSSDPELKHLKKEMKTSFNEIAQKKYDYQLSGYSTKIRFWVDEHHSQNFVIIRYGKMKNEFGSRFINTSSPLKESQTVQAFKILKNSR